MVSPKILHRKCEDSQLKSKRPEAGVAACSISSTPPDKLQLTVGRGTPTDLSTALAAVVVAAIFSPGASDVDARIVCSVWPCVARSKGGARDESTKCCRCSYSCSSSGRGQMQ